MKIFLFVVDRMLSLLYTIFCNDFIAFYVWR
nr:MAG TPA: hypothetical protein [Bacteriophage sp.]